MARADAPDVDLALVGPRPYAKAGDRWLAETEAAFRDILAAAGHHHATLRRLETMFDPRGLHMLDFLEISQAEVENALRVCEKVMRGLGPTGQELRREMELRASAKADR